MDDIAHLVMCSLIVFLRKFAALAYYVILLSLLYELLAGGNTLQGTNYTATCLPSRKLSKLDEPVMQVTAGEAGTRS